MPSRPSPSPSTPSSFRRATSSSPTDEVTGEYLASLPVGLDTYERERAAAHLDDVFTAHRETTAVVRIPLSNDHSGKLITYELQRHDQDPRPF